MLTSERVMPPSIGELRHGEQCQIMTNDGRCVRVPVSAQQTFIVGEEEIDPYTCREIWRVRRIPGT